MGIYKVYISSLHAFLVQQFSFHLDDLDIWMQRSQLVNYFVSYLYLDEYTQVTKH